MCPLSWWGLVAEAWPAATFRRPFNASTRHSQNWRPGMKSIGILIKYLRMMTKVFLVLAYRPRSHASTHTHHTNKYHCKTQIMPNNVCNTVRHKHIWKMSILYQVPSYPPDAGRLQGGLCGSPPQKHRHLGPGLCQAEQHCEKFCNYEIFLMQ